ncbi:MAG TPA: hypothetical protein VIM30_02420 [Candidatus Limnocylindrales bacterium]|jgi:hypothetical protein
MGHASDGVARRAAGVCRPEVAAMSSFHVRLDRAARVALPLATIIAIALVASAGWRWWPY